MSWWGWGDMDLDGNIDEQAERYIEQRSHDALLKLLDQIESKDLKFKVTVMVEPWPDIAMPTPDYQRPPNAALNHAALNLSDAQKQVIFDYLASNVYDVYPDQIFQWKGKPLLIAVPRLFFRADADDRFTLRNPRFRHEDIDPGNAWNWIITDTLPYIQDVHLQDSEDEETIAILSPRYDEWFLAAANPSWWPEAWGRLETGPVRHDPYLKENLYDFEWRQIYERREDIDLIILWAWNSRMEQLYIEPDDGENGAAPASDLLVRKTAWYARRFLSGAPFQMFEPDWVAVKDFCTALNPISPQQLNLRSEAEVDQVLHRIIRQAQSHVSTYLRRSFDSSEPVPDGVVEVVTRLSSSIYNYLLSTKSGNLVRVGEFGVDDLANTVFTDGMK